MHKTTQIYCTTAKLGIMARNITLKRGMNGPNEITETYIRRVYNACLHSHSH